MPFRWEGVAYGLPSSFSRLQGLFGGEQTLNELVGGAKQDSITLFDQGMADRAQQMRFAAPGQSEGQQVLRLIHKVTLT